MITSASLRASEIRSRRRSIICARASTTPSGVAELVRHAGGESPHRHQSIRVVQLLEVRQAPRCIGGGLGALLGIDRVDVLELARQLFELARQAARTGSIARIRAQTLRNGPFLGASAICELSTLP